MTAPAARKPCIVGSVLYGADEAVAAYVASRIAAMDQRRRFGQRDPVTGALPYAALGVVRGDPPVMVGGVVFNNLREHRGRPIDIEMAAAFAPQSRWCTRAILNRLFSYPFVQIGCIRMTTITGRHNKPARRIDEGLGFRLEGVRRKAIDGREDAMMYGMLRTECRWLKEG